MSINAEIKKILDTLVFGNFKKKRTTDYWWNLHKNAKKPGLHGYLSKQKYHKLVDAHNAFIPLAVHFAGKPVMPHGINGIFISSGAKIGLGCTIFHQVTIGSNTLSDSRGYGTPVIGDNVYIGCGAKIIGHIHIGDNVRIGANCVVTTDIPANCTVVMEKPRIIKKENNQNTFVPYTGG